jgi:hypothetical protein
MRRLIGSSDQGWGLGWLWMRWSATDCSAGRALVHVAAAGGAAHGLPPRSMGNDAQVAVD